MLHFISWKMYGISLIGGLAFFYGYVGYKNFRLITRFAGRLWTAANKGEPAPKKKEADAGKEPGAGKEADPAKDATPGKAEAPGKDATQEKTVAPEKEAIQGKDAGPRKAASPGKKADPGNETSAANGNAITGLVLVALLIPAAGWAQTADGATGINQANTMIRSYFDPAVNLMYAAGALAGLVGGYKVYKSMNNKDHDADNRATVWFAGCIFLVLVATVLKSFFGI
ncbi:MAG TPA: DUF4134 family protein [Puia sp.]|uniref:DUF4134 domain-containing protein n=1 Tax=Puia sp. TaxID=2045100 RepID=UPI002BC47DF3|nr:DUF4134 family protein [Puia sp.]HVU97988.1 DUF4134 family protein [Puia sp.]